MAHFGEMTQIITRETPIQVVILCGGRGERLGGLTLERPKPMIEIGGKPILAHIMGHFVRHGFTDFVLALGYLGWAVEYYFREQGVLGDDVTVRCVPTGWNTQNAGRIKRVADCLDGTFLMAWCDGLTDLDLTAMLAFHRQHGKLCTVAAVLPQERFGTMELLFCGGIAKPGGAAFAQVMSFREKQQSSQWINGGFFVCEPGVLDYIGGDVAPDKVQWEREPMERLAKDGQLMAFAHQGFWQCMDTEKEQRMLDDLCRRGQAPWVKR